MPKSGWTNGGDITRFYCACISFSTYLTGKTIEVSVSSQHSVNNSKSYNEENEVEEPLLKDSSVELNKFSYLNDVFKKVRNYFYR